MQNGAKVEASLSVSTSSFVSNLDLVEDIVKRITGNQDVVRATNLRELGLDSLGETALLGTLRASVPAARKLTLRQLSTIETVGQLVDALDALSESEKEKEAENYGAISCDITPPSIEV
jgi:acyl carrier protein